MVNETEIERLLFQQVEKPSRHSDTKIFNTYNDVFRINVYHEIFDEELQIDKKRMHSSYSCYYRNKQLIIRDI
jgi:hypothetical protein